MGWNQLLDELSTPEQQAIVEQAAARLQGLPLDELRNRQHLQELAASQLMSVASRQGTLLTPQLRTGLVHQVVARIGGLGFFNELLPPARSDLSEISLTPNGEVQVWRKGERHFEKLDLKPSLEETWRAVEALLAPQGRSLSEAAPTVDARLPRMAGMGGARIKIIHPLLAPGRGFPSINIRLFEAEPVPVEQLLAWQVVPEKVLHSLLEAVRQEYRLLIFGGTGSGKTTVLSALGNAIPKQDRVVKVEDPEEIWLDHPHVVTLEARPAVVGSAVPPYTVRDGVNDALRMSPRWLIVGEVRTGDVALDLFRAQMSDHPGISTFHAESPAMAAHRMAIIMQADAGVDKVTAKESFAAAVDLVVQVGWWQERRQVLGAWVLEPFLKGDQVVFDPLYLVEGYTPTATRRARVNSVFAEAGV